VSERIPPPPELVREWIRRWAGATPEAAPPESVDAAVQALHAALDRTGRRRETAEALLAADALLTYAVEDAAAAPDPESALDALLRRVGEVEPPRHAVELLERARAQERAQTRFYRALAAEAELAGRARAAERLNELLADEQHHLSRVSARLLELGGARAEAPAMAPRREEAVPVELEQWEEEARAREEAEVAFYLEAEADPHLDPRTRALLREIRESEEHHRRELGGKWMRA
jgi:rubrerythrin